MVNAAAIPYGRQDINEEDVAAVVAALRSSHLTCGGAVTAFEAALTQVTGARHAVACANGTAALHLACLALQLKPGDLGVTSPITFLASANCFEYCGMSTDFVDIDRDTLCLSPEQLADYCAGTAVPRAIVAVSFAGVPADLAALQPIARRYGCYLIEDAAHAIGSTYDVGGVRFQCGSCSHSDLAVFSFHPVKTVTTAEGGAILTNDDHLAERLRLLRTHGMQRDPQRMSRCDGPWYYEMEELGYNYRLSDIQCALGISQLKRLDAFKARRQAIVDRYNAAFAQIAALITPPWPSSTSPCFHLYPLQLKEGPAARARMVSSLNAAGIFSQIHYIPLYYQPYYQRKYRYAPGKCPNAERYYSRCLSLPLFPAMTDDEVSRVIEAVTSASQ